MTNRTAVTLAIVSIFFFIVQAVAVAGRCYHRIQANRYAAKDLVGAALHSDGNLTADKRDREWERWDGRSMTTSSSLPM